ncbi:unnamed protein product [Phytophthora lilii]|uniref:Unnamed protein product n=1 Tax=Phytophthora lilii TaxID=2077276 RepID=A0A9W6TH37_9STRA|nr:unnamed protein product [Phytophthora lilii]
MDIEYIDAQDPEPIHVDANYYLIPARTPKSKVVESRITLQDFDRITKNTSPAKVSDEEGTASRVSTRIKPALTAKNKLHRVESALIYIDDASMDFETMEDVVHVHEKWFNEDKNKRSYIVFEEEAPPTRSRRSKNFIPKTMFLAAVARPRIWDGNLGIWAFTEEYVAQRTSKYRTKGTLCQNNAKPHVSPFDPDIVAAGSVDGWFIGLIFQPPNSPDYNALDLGLFASIQSIQYRYAIRDINNLIDVVEAAYEELSTTTQDNVFLTLLACMLCVLEADGGNDYTIPHQSKEKLRRAGLLPRVLTCDRALYERSCQLLRDAGRPSCSWFPGSSQ